MFIFHNKMASQPALNKPQVVNTPSEQTGEIITSSQQDSKAPNAQQSNRAFNISGIRILSGGNVLGTPFLPSVLDAYTNLFSYQYIAAFFMVVSTVYFLGKIHAVTFDIFDSFHSSVTTTHANSQGIHKSITALATFISRQTINYKTFLATFMAFSGPYLAKPSTRNAYVAMFLTLLAVIITLTPLNIILLSHLFFLAVTLRDPYHKTFVIIIAVVTVLLSYEVLSFDPNITSEKAARYTNRGPVQPVVKTTTPTPSSTAQVKLD